MWSLSILSVCILSIFTYPLVMLLWLLTIYKLYYYLTGFPGQFFNFKNSFFTNARTGKCQVGSSNGNDTLHRPLFGIWNDKKKEWKCISLWDKKCHVWMITRLCKHFFFLHRHASISMELRKWRERYAKLFECIQLFISRNKYFMKA